MGVMAHAAMILGRKRWRAEGRAKAVLWGMLGTCEEQQGGQWGSSQVNEGRAREEVTAM